MSMTSCVDIGECPSRALTSALSIRKLTGGEILVLGSVSIDQGIGNRIFVAIAFDVFGGQHIGGLKLARASAPHTDFDNNAVALHFLEQGLDKARWVHDYFAFLDHGAAARFCRREMVARSTP